MTEIVALVSPFLVMLRKVPYWLDNVLEQIEPFNPYRKVEAETMAWGYGLKTDVVEGRGIVLRDIDAGEYLLLKGVDFGARGARKLTLCVEGAAGVEVHLDVPDGPLCGSIVPKAGKAGFREVSCSMKGAAGVHDLYFVFTSGGFRWDWWKMAR